MTSTKYQIDHWVKINEANALLYANAEAMAKLLEEASELMPLGTAKRAEWLIRVSKLRRNLRGE